MDLDPDSVLAVIQFKRPRSARHTEMPVTATGMRGKLTLAADDKTSSLALVKRLLGGEV
jgi:hypothetical protein